MKNYFTSIEHVNEKFIGSVHDANTNQLVFRTTRSHNTPAEAIQEVNNFLQGEQTGLVSVPETVASAPTPSNVQIPEPAPVPRRCCGR